MLSFLSKRKKRGIAADEIPEGAIANLDELELELTHVGRYEIVAPIGSGGMGTVYKAIDRERDLTVAIKVLDRRYDLDKRRRSRDYLGREIEIAASLNHPAIVKIHKEIIVQEDRQGHMRRCLLMEFVDGPNLRKYIQDRSLTFRQMMEICRNLC
ncbi:MAG TPA: protein kinase, partial [Candidatus Hydrogenedentes bacterium]|nr:protein kinase [Candidatus Hydrogenedentota bacterium]